MCALRWRRAYLRAQVWPQSRQASDAYPDEVRIAFDGDAVLFSDEAERVFQAQGLDAFQQHENRKPPSPWLLAPLNLCWVRCSVCNTPIVASWAGKWAFVPLWSPQQRPLRMNAPSAP